MSAAAHGSRPGSLAAGGGPAAVTGRAGILGPVPILPAHLDVLACPVCGGRFERDEGTLRCAEGHAVDLARQGHVQLARRPIRHPGDTAGMLAARARVLEAGTFAPLTSALVAAGGPAGVVLEVGAGTAHHLAAVVEACGGIGVALDSSKAAGKVAARAHPRVASVVADATERLPLQDDSVDVVLVAFAPRNVEEIARVLAPGGRVVLAHPTSGHLAGLRAALDLLAVREDKGAAIADRLGERFVEGEQVLVEAAVDVDHDRQVDLVMMGPNAFHTDREAVAGQVAAAGLDQVAISVAVQVWTLREGGRT